MSTASSDDTPFKYGFSFSAVFPIGLPPDVANAITFFPLQS